MSALPLFQLATRLNTQNTYETEIHNGFMEINFYMNIRIWNWQFEVSTHENEIFAFFLILTSKNPKLIST